MNFAVLKIIVLAIQTPYIIIEMLFSQFRCFKSIMKAVLYTSSHYNDNYMFSWYNLNLKKSKCFAYWIALKGL